MKLIYDVSDKPPFGKNLVFALQQMIAIMAATLLVPIIVTGYGLESDPAVALFGAGIGTLVYLLFTKRKSPVFEVSDKYSLMFRKRFHFPYLYA